MEINLSEIRKKTVPAEQYVSALDQPFRDYFLATKQTYRLQPEATNQLRGLADKYVVVAFSAGWCKDCAKYIPVLALISEATGLEVRVFGGIKKDPLSHTCKWRIPPSPPEVRTFGIDKLPIIIVFDTDGREIGRIIETPRQWPTLEQELYALIESQQ
jgi:thiol-disulfide isomerase/thioredoxin